MVPLAGGNPKIKRLYSMPLTFDQIAAVIPQYVAKGALTQLNLSSVFAKASIGDYEDFPGQKGDAITLRKPRIVEIEDYDPRGANAARSEDPGFITARLTLERLFTGGFPVYGTDLAVAGVEGYVKEYANQISGQVGGEFDRYLYNKFRTLPATMPITGSVAYAAAPPLAIAAALNNTGTESAPVDGANFVDFNKSVLIRANTLLDQANVPATNRYAILSSVAKGSFLGDSVLIEGFAAAAANSAEQLTGGLPIGQFVPRYGFMCGGSNVVGMQEGNPAIATAISAVVDDAAIFLAGDSAAQTPLGAVRLTVASAAGLAAGRIARIGTTNNTVAFGLILRVDGTSVFLVPYSPRLGKLVAAQIPASQNLYLPNIPSISIAYHKETLVFGTRPLGSPTPGSGAVAATESDRNTGLSMQVFKGSYDVNRLKESQRVTMLCGATITDYRKAAFMLSL